MRLLVVLAVLSIFLMPAVHAGGNLTVSGANMAPSFANANTTVSFLNITLSVASGSGDGTVNITAINITIGGSAAANTTGNITTVILRNETGAAVGSNTSINSATNITKITIANGFVVTSAASRSMVLAIQISPAARLLATVSGGVNLSRDVGTADPGNVTIAGTNTSSASQIQDIHAFAAASPSFADTSVANQTFIYNVTITGRDALSNFTITLPSNYTVVNVTNITHSPGVLLNGTFKDSVLGSTPTITQNAIFVSHSTGFTSSSGTIRVAFILNTNSSGAAASNFSSRIGGSNLTNVDADAASDSTIVTTKQLLRIEEIKVVKNSAIINDTDYWEFNITVNFTANVSGWLQFRMNKWNNSAGQIINFTNQTELTNTTRYYATLRNESDFSKHGKNNITENYNITYGLPYMPSSTPGVEGTVRTVMLRMVIPSGTPVTTNWFTSFGMIFRSFA